MVRKLKARPMKPRTRDNLSEVKWFRKNPGVTEKVRRLHEWEISEYGQLSRNADGVIVTKNRSGALVKKFFTVGLVVHEEFTTRT